MLTPTRNPSRFQAAAATTTTTTTTTTFTEYAHHQQCKYRFCKD
jgi:hypothetical protein